MPRSVAFVEEPGCAIIDKRGVVITYKSGGDTFVRRMAVEDFRTFIAHGTDLLNSYDAAQRERVVPIGKKREPGH
jgi:hypothetical protein